MRTETMLKWTLPLASGLFALLLPLMAFALDVGPAVGAKAPPIVGKTWEGRAASLASITGPKGAVVVFHRSAAWCPFCQAQLIALKDAQAPLMAEGYSLVAISYDAPEVLAQFKARREIGYPLLSDTGSATIKAFNLLDPQYPPGHRAYGVPQPAIFVLSRSGVVQAKLAEEGYRNRPPVSAVLDAVKAASARP
ncbi:MAG: peroxiredoxin family protein [Phenylobacterium sp.]|nr:peroxiredoxin family protein [Phenylobacterium sp.]